VVGRRSDQVRVPTSSVATRPMMATPSGTCRAGWPLMPSRLWPMIASRVRRWQAACGGARGRSASQDGRTS